MLTSVAIDFARNFLLVMFRRRVVGLLRTHVCVRLCACLTLDLSLVRRVLDARDRFCFGFPLLVRGFGPPYRKFELEPGIVRSGTRDGDVVVLFVLVIVLARFLFALTFMTLLLFELGVILIRGFIARTSWFRDG